MGLGRRVSELGVRGSCLFIGSSKDLRGLFYGILKGYIVGFIRSYRVLQLRRGLSLWMGLGSYRPSGPSLEFRLEGLGFRAYRV